MLNSTFCVVCLDIDQLHLHLLERNRRELFLFFTFFQSNLHSLQCMTCHFILKALNENQETQMLSLVEFHSWRLRVFQVYYKAAYDFQVIDIIYLDQLLFRIHRKTLQKDLQIHCRNSIYYILQIHCGRFRKDIKIFVEKNLFLIIL